MRIGELAELAGVTAKTVRYYESIGLMPAPGRSGNGYREYGDEELARLRFIRDSQATGLSLAEIQSVLELKGAGASTCRHTRDLLTEHLTEIDEQIARLQHTRAQLADLARRAAALDPTECVDPNRCQVIDATRHADTH